MDDLTDDRLRELLQRWEPSQGSTHYRGCEAEHYGCAILLLCRALRDARRREAGLKEAVRAFSATGGGGDAKATAMAYGRLLAAVEEADG